MARGKNCRKQAVLFCVVRLLDIQKNRIAGKIYLDSITIQQMVAVLSTDVLLQSSK